MYAAPGGPRRVESTSAVTCVYIAQHEVAFQSAGSSHGVNSPDPDVPSRTTSEVSGSTPFRATTSDKRSAVATVEPRNTCRNSKPSSGGFQLWRENRREARNKEEASAAEVNILEVDHDHGRRCSPSPANSVYSSQTIAPDMFDSLADQIVHRVKRELNLNKDTVSSHSSSSTQPWLSSNNHCCLNCKNLMVRRFNAK